MSWIARRRRVALALAVALVAALFVSAAPVDAAARRPAYQNPDLPTRVRVEDLLRRMTLEEKVGQMTQISVQVLLSTDGYWSNGPINWERLEEVLGQNQVGSILSGGGGSPESNTARAWAELTNTLQEATLERSRLGIPLLYGADAVHGHNNLAEAQMYPHNLGLGAAGDRELVTELAALTARDLRATGVHWNFGPVLDVGRDPRWGRFYESWGEDRVITEQLGVASIIGQQGDDLAAPDAVAATAKHFMGYGQPLNGNDRNPADFSMRTLREVHLPPHEAAVDAGVATAMANSGSINAVPVHASEFLLEDVLRDELDFGGLVVSDWEDIIKLQTVHGVAADYDDAIELAVEAGVDMSMVPYEATPFTTTLVDLVRSGRVSERRIDQAVRRILTLKFELGLFEDPFVDPDEADAIINGADPEVARRAARETMTLLSNDGTLPLAGDEDVLVTGPSADSLRNQLGGWSVGWQGVPEDGSRGVPEGTTVLEGVLDAVDDPAQVTALPEATAEEAAAAAEGADVAVVVVGEPPYAEFLGDSDTLALPEGQAELIAAVEGTGTPTVLVTIAGRPLVMADEIAGSAATLMAYLPGSEGGAAVADVLFGEHNPTGRLPFSWPRAVGQLPMTYDALRGTTYDPLLPFGHGLSYTTFAYSDLSVGRVARDGTADVTVTVTNTGDVAGTDVVQAFAQQPVSPPLIPPLNRLVGFERAPLEPSASTTVTMEVDVDDLARVPGDVDGDGRPRRIPGDYTVRVGDQTAVMTVR